MSVFTTSTTPPEPSAAPDYGQPMCMPTCLPMPVGCAAHVPSCGSWESAKCETDCRLRAGLGVGMGAQKLPGKQETDKEIALQGNLLAEATRFLVQEYGLDPTHHIEVKQKGKP